VRATYRSRRPPADRYSWTQAQRCCGGACQIGARAERNAVPASPATQPARGGGHGDSDEASRAGISGEPGAGTGQVRRRIESNSEVSLSSFDPTGVPHTEQRYSYLFPVGRTNRRWRRTGRAALQRGQNSSAASNSSNWDRLLIVLRLERAQRFVKGSVGFDLRCATFS
jgi:hypothetical protein